VGTGFREFLSDRAGWWIAVVVLLVTGWPALVLADRELIAAFTDDTFYYLVVARHVAVGDGFTFDGLHPTNGFQPLWLFMLVPVFWLVSGDFLPLRVLILMQSALLAAGAALLWGILRSRFSGATAAAVPLLVVGLPGASSLWLGMEGSLFFLLLVATWVAWLRIETRAPAASVGDWALLGGCCALLFLARIEGGAALPVALLLGWQRLRRGPRAAAALAGLVAPTAIAGGSYLVWNIISFQKWLPISGTVKMHWVGLLDPFERFLGLLDLPWVGRNLVEHAFGGRTPPRTAFIASGLVFITILGVAGLYRKPLVRALRDAGAIFIVLVCAVIFVVDHVMIGPFLGEWALVSMQLLTAIALGLLITRIRGAGAIALIVALLLCMARVPAQARNAKHWDGRFTGRSLVLAEWIRARTPPEARVGSVFAGVLGYFSERTVINLDGLVNSVDYYERVLVGEEWETYLQQERISHLVHVGCDTGVPIITMLDYMHKETKNLDCYSLEHFVRDPSRPENCGLLLFDVSWERCGGPEAALVHPVLKTAWID
jgi:hypothetical protein